MEIEYSNEVRGQVFAYRFCKTEKAAIANGLKPYLKKLEKSVLKIENDPNNEGQATYLCRIDELNTEIKEIEKIITEFSK